MKLINKLLSALAHYSSIIITYVTVRNSYILFLYISLVPISLILGIITGGFFFDWYCGTVQFDCLLNLDPNVPRKEIEDAPAVLKEFFESTEPLILEKDLTPEQRKEYHDKKGTMFGISLMLIGLIVLIMMDLPPGPFLS